MMKISFEEVMERLNQLSLPSFDLVLGIANGGLIPAALVAAKIKAPLATVTVQYRDKNNVVMYPQPRFMGPFHLPPGLQSVLLVDDVSVTGETMNAVRALLREAKVRVQTLVFKGKADYVLLPEAQACVDWPWKKIQIMEA